MLLCILFKICEKKFEKNCCKVNAYTWVKFDMFDMRDTSVLHDQTFDTAIFLTSDTMLAIH